MTLPTLVRKMLAEFIGVMLFLTAITGASNGVIIAITLGLGVLVTSSVSGGHLNPVVSLYFYSRKEMTIVEFLAYVAAQLAGAFAGVALAHYMFAKNIKGFDATAYQFSGAQFVSEIVATAGLVWLISTLIANKQFNVIPFGITLWILAASAFTPTGAQANPAVTVGKMFNGDVTISQGATLILAEIVGLMVAVILGMLLTSATAKKKAAAKK